MGKGRGEGRPDKEGRDFGGRGSQRAFLAVFIVMGWGDDIQIANREELLGINQPAPRCALA